MAEQSEWKCVNNDETYEHATWRLDVHGGWLYRHSYYNSPLPDTMVFVPYPNNPPI